MWSSSTWHPFWSPHGCLASLIRAGSSSGASYGHQSWPRCLKAVSSPAGPQPCSCPLQLAQLKAKLLQPFGHWFEQLPIQRAGLQPGQVSKDAPKPPTPACPKPLCPSSSQSLPPPSRLDLTYALWPRPPGSPPPLPALPGDPARVPAGQQAQPSITAPKTSLSDRKQLAPSKRRSSDKHSLGNNKVAK